VGDDVETSPLVGMPLRACGNRHAQRRLRQSAPNVPFYPTLHRNILEEEPGASA
jgi:hypothetical protein